VPWKPKLKNGSGFKGGRVFKLEKRLRKLEAALDRFRVNRINEVNVRVARVGLATAEAMLTPAEFRQLVEEFKRAVPEPGPEEKAANWQKDKKASLARLAITVGLFIELAPRIRQVMVENMQRMEGHALDIELLERIIIPVMAGEPKEEVFSAFEQGGSQPSAS
jgi:hypothetical protein